MSSILRRLTPTNLLEEKEKFLLDQNYNPQFVYEEPTFEHELVQHGIPSKKYYDLAQEIIDRTYFGRNEEDLNMLEGKQLDQDDVTQKISDFLKMHHLEDTIDIVWSHSFISRTTISAESIKLRLPVDFRREGLLGMLYHEIGTHALRRINYEQQPWFKRKKKYGFSDYLKTEEGLASLHTLLPKSFQSAYVQALRYMVVEVAQKASFVELWNYLGKYVQNFERRWIICIRGKRGLTDTSLPGGFSKDLVYFEGLVDVWQWLTKNDCRLNEVYFGKLAIEDIDKAVQLNPHFEPRLPSFYVLDKESYQKNIANIGKENQFDQL